MERIVHYLRLSSIDEIQSEFKSWKNRDTYGVDQF